MVVRNGLPFKEAFGDKGTPEDQKIHDRWKELGMTQRITDSQ